MRKVIILFTAAALVIGLAACSTSPRNTSESGAKMAKEDISKLPSWVKNMEVSEDAIYGIGYAKMSNLSNSRRVALARAREDVSYQVKTTIQSMMTDYQQEAGVDDSGQVINFVETVSRQITDNVLAGLSPDKQEIMDDGGVWVRVVYRKNQFVDDAKEAFMRNENAAFAEFKADQATKKLESTIENNPPKSNPVTE